MFWICYFIALSIAGIYTENNFGEKKHFFRSRLDLIVLPSVGQRLS